MLLVNTMSGHKRATDSESGLTNVTYRDTANNSDGV